jgi:hypothetical protein
MSCRHNLPCTIIVCRLTGVPIDVYVGLVCVSDMYSDVVAGGLHLLGAPRASSELSCWGLGVCARCTGKSVMPGHNGAAGGGVHKDVLTARVLRWLCSHVEFIHGPTKRADGCG